MQNINESKCLDKSNYVRSLHESKISKRKDKRNKNLVCHDDSVCHSEGVSRYSITSENDNSRVLKFNLENMINQEIEKDTINKKNTEDNLELNVDNKKKLTFHYKNCAPPETKFKNKKKNIDLNCDIKDLSDIIQNDNNFLKESIHNSIFNNDNFSTVKIEEIETNNMDNDILNDSHLISIDQEEKQLGEVIFQKIINAKYNEEIVLPERQIKMKCLLINKPVKIIGQPNSTLEITEGPISINILENSDKDLIKFSQVKIKFDITQTERSIIKNYKGEHAKFTVLFRLYPGSVVEIEDCDITCTKDSSIPISKHKLVCFQLMYCKYLCKNLNNKANDTKNDIIVPNPETGSPTILTIISSKIEKFYQTIRAAENCIVNIEKSFINKNVGKSIAILNPLILKIVGSTFEGNGENAVHIKFVKEENLQENRKLFFKNNEFSYNFGTGIYIDGIENMIIDLELVVDGNLFKKNKCDSIFMLDLYIKSLIISKNKFLCGKLNGLNMNRVYQKNNTNSQYTNVLTSASYSQDLPVIELKENEFIENDGFGIILNDCKAQIIMNNFFENRACGLLLININNSKNNSGKFQPFTQQIINTSSILVENCLGNSNSFSVSNGTCYLFKNSFWKNGGCGLKIVNYNYFVLASSCSFKENVEYGVFIEMDNSINMLNQNSQSIQSNSILTSDKIKSFRDADNSKVPKDTNLFLLNSTISNNMKSGIFLNNSFLFIENTIISDNIDYAIHIPLEEFRYCYKESKLHQRNLTNGNIGGNWGEITLTSKALCNGCTSTPKTKRFNNNLNNPNNKNLNTIQDFNPNIQSGPNQNASNKKIINAQTTTPNGKIPNDRPDSKNFNVGKNNDHTNNSKCLII